MHRFLSLRAGFLVPAVVLALSLMLGAVASASAPALQLLGSSRDQVLDVLSESASGGQVVAAGTNEGGFAAPNSLYSFGSATDALTLGSDQYVPAGAVSPNGRFVVWETGPCDRTLFHGNTRDSVVYLRDETATRAPVSRVRLPPDWTRIGVIDISVDNSGQITLLASHSEDDNCLGSFSTGPYKSGTQPQGGPNDAILAATPNARAFHVVATDRVGGDAVESPDRHIDGLCDVGKHEAVLDVASGDGSRAIREASLNPFCEISNTGTTFSLGGRSDRTLLASDRHTYHATLPVAGKNAGYAFLGQDATDPTQSGVILTVDNERSGARPTTSLVLWRPGRGSPRVIPVPKQLRGWSLDTGAWLTPSTVIDFPGDPGANNRVILFDPQTRKWGPLDKLGAPGLGVEDCALPSGQILLAAGKYLLGSHALENARLYESSGLQLRRLQVGLQDLAGLSCPGGPAVYLAARQKLYRVASQSLAR